MYTFAVLGAPAGPQSIIAVQEHQELNVPCRLGRSTAVLWAAWVLMVAVWLQMVCELLLNRGDYILTEEYTYPSVIESVIIPKGYKALGVKLDQDGILPESLLEVSFGTAIHSLTFLHYYLPLLSFLCLAYGTWWHGQGMFTIIIFCWRRHGLRDRIPLTELI